jgi:hypothetical protein
MMIFLCVCKQTQPQRSQRAQRKNTKLNCFFPGLRQATPAGAGFVCFVTFVVKKIFAVMIVFSDVKVSKGTTN